MTDRPDNPFKGLSPYRREDSNKLFGRDKDLVLMKDRIFSAKTTLLFAGSGVGKTSFLNAKIIPDLEGSHSVLYHNIWSGPDTPLLMIKKALAALLRSSEESTTLPLADMLAQFRKPGAPPNAGAMPKDVSGVPRCLIILDQFEEVFQYHAFEDYFKQFLDELSEVINSHGLQVRVVLSMREEFLGELSVFDNRIPDLFNNYYRLKYPDKYDAADIITNTCKLVGVDVSDKLEDLVNDLSRIERVGPAPGSDAGKDSSNVRMITRDFVVPPHLQIACHRIWEKQPLSSDGQFVFLSSYNVANGARLQSEQPSFVGSPRNDARDALRDFCNETLNSLGFRERRLASRAFDYLITKQGAKMAYELNRLSKHMGASEKRLGVTLKKLCKPEARILRESRGADGSVWFELYHDMYGPLVDLWNQRFRARERRWIARGTAAAVVIAAIILGFNYFAYRPYRLKRVIRQYKDDLRSGSVSQQDEAAAHVAFLNVKSTYNTLRAVFGYRGTADALWADMWEKKGQLAENRLDRESAFLFFLEALRTGPDKSASLRIRKEANELVSDDYNSILASYQPEKGQIRKALFSADGQVLMTEVFSQEAGIVVQLWETSSGHPMARADHLEKDFIQNHPRERPSDETGVPDPRQFKIESIACRPGTAVRVAGAIGGRAYSWMVEAGKFTAESQSPWSALKAVTSVSLSPDGRYIALGLKRSRTSSASVRMWKLTPEVAAPSQVALPLYTSVDTLMFNPDGGMLLAQSGELTSLFEVAAHSLKAKRKTAQGSVSFAPDGRSLFVISPDYFQVFDSTTLKRKGVGLPVRYGSGTDPDPAYAAQIDRDGHTLFLIGRTGSALIYDAETGSLSGTLSRPGYKCVGLAPFGDAVLASTKTGLRLLSLDSPTLRRNYPSLAAMDSGGNVLATVTGGNLVQIFKAAPLDPIGQMAQPFGAITRVDLSANANLVVIGREDRIDVLDLNTGTLIGSVADRHNYFSLSPDGYTLATEGFGDINAFRLLPSPKEIFSTSDGWSYDFSPDSRYLVTTAAYNLRVLDLTSGVVKAQDLPRGQPLARRFLPRASTDRLVLWDYDGPFALVWDVARAARVAELRSDEPIRWANISPDGQWVVTIGESKTSIWDAGTGQKTAERISDRSQLAWGEFSDDSSALILFGRDWIYRYNVHAPASTDGEARFLGNASWTPFLDKAATSARLLLRSIDGSFNVRDIKFGTRDDGPPLEGDPAELWGRWSERLALTIDEEGSIKPLW
jgi:WD40 repeat protein